ncbi:hypothetical protein TNCV_5109541 [Trichonephila clavipes]|nr:hypothetical protein TNCV_5109541 [Trichonephila clavipes]
MLVRLPRAPVLSGGLRRKTQLFSCTLYMAASSKTPPHQSKGLQKFKTPLPVPGFPGSSPLCHHTNSENPSDTTSFHSVLWSRKERNVCWKLRAVQNCYPIEVGWDVVPIQMMSLSLDHGSKLQRPSPTAFLVHLGGEGEVFPIGSDTSGRDSRVVAVASSCSASNESDSKFHRSSAI